MEVFVIERFGRFDRLLSAGLSFTIPLMDHVAYMLSLKVNTIEIPDQVAITRDNVSIRMDGVLYFQVVDAHAAAYNIDDHKSAVLQLAVSTMRAEIGKLILEKTFQEREQLNERINEAINSAASEWGVKCLRYEIRDIVPPQRVMEAMELQVVAERRKREQIITSEGEQQAAINVAEGRRQAVTLESQAERTRLMNVACGEADAIRERARASAEAIEQLAKAIGSAGGHDAVALRVAEQYVAAFGQLAKSTNTLLLPTSSDPAAFVASAMSIFEKIRSISAAGSSSVTTATVSGHAVRPEHASDSNPVEADNSSNQTGANN